MSELRVDEHDVFLLERIEDGNGNQKNGKMYFEMINNYCTSLCVRKDFGAFFLTFKILCDSSYNIKFGKFNTSNIRDIILDEHYFIIKTLNSKYVFKRVDINIGDLLEVEEKTNTIELWIKGTGSYFGMGYYWDEAGEIISLDRKFCHGELCDTVVVSDCERDYCKYSIVGDANRIEFDHQIYEDNGIQPKILIHNTTNENLIVSLRTSNHKWIINPHEQKYILFELSSNVN